MLLDLIKFFGDELTPNSYKHCPVAFVEVLALRAILVRKLDHPGAGAMSLVIENVAYEFKDRDKCIAAARRLADLYSEMVEQNRSTDANVRGKIVGKEAIKVAQKLSEPEAIRDPDPALPAPAKMIIQGGHKPK